MRYHWKLVTDLHATCPWTATWMIIPNTNVPDLPYTACHEWDVTGAARPAHQHSPRRRDHVRLAIGSVAHPQYGQAAYSDIAAGMSQYWKQLGIIRASP